MSGNNDQFTQRMRQRCMKVLAKASLEDLDGWRKCRPGGSDRIDPANKETVKHLILEARTRGTAMVGIFHDQRDRDVVTTRSIELYQISNGT